jgi:NAD(P)-dependent dehydrogenase (short-subunit alcohol dehydrogenase family)
MIGPLKGQTVLVIGRGGGIANAITLAARDAGALVIAAGRDRGALGAVYDGTRLRLEPGQTVIPHGIDRDLTTHEVGPGRKP